MVVFPFIFFKDGPGYRVHTASAKHSRREHNIPIITNPQMTPEMYKQIDKLIETSLAESQGSAYVMESARAEGLSKVQQLFPSASRSLASDGNSMQQRERYLTQLNQSILSSVCKQLLLSRTMRPLE